MNKELLETILNATKQDFNISFKNDNRGVRISLSKRSNGSVKGESDVINYEEIEKNEVDIVKSFIETAKNRINN